MAEKLYKNLKADIKRCWPLLLGNILYFLTMNLSSAVIWGKIYEIVSPRLISLQTATGWLMGVLLGLAWEKWNKKMLPLLIPFHFVQMIFYVLFFIYAEATQNIFVYWCIGFFQYTMIGVFCDKIYSCATAFFFKKPEERASFDNLENTSICISSCLGALIGVAYVPGLRMAIFFDLFSTFIWSVLVLIYAVPRKKYWLLDEPVTEENNLPSVSQ